MPAPAFSHTADKGRCCGDNDLGNDHAGRDPDRGGVRRMLGDDAAHKRKHGRIREVKCHYGRSEYEKCLVAEKSSHAGS